MTKGAGRRKLNLAVSVAKWQVASYFDYVENDEIQPATFFNIF